MMWDSLRFQGASDPTLFRYQPYRIIANAATPIGLPLEDTKREFIDNVGIDEPKVCYRVGGKYKYTLPDGSTEDAESQSNVVCVEQSTTFFLPNAFTPGGKNPEFRPLFAYPDNIGAYSMDIFDRWGSPIFSTTTPTTGWDGRRGTEDLPQGAYAYIVRVTQANGNVVEQKGVVVLLR